MASAKHDVHWMSAALTDPGKVRKFNEDAFVNLSERFIWAVADGMGGHHAGDVASRLIADSLASMPVSVSITDAIATCKQSIAEVNATLFRNGVARSAKVTGSTVATLLSCGKNCAVLWAGDSRVYCLRAGELMRLTRDHSRVEELIQRGRLARSEAEQHPQANVITRAVGVAEVVELETRLLELEDRDRFLICSDGLTRYLDETELAESLRLGSCDAACTDLMQKALLGPARDNITLVVAEASFSATQSNTLLNTQLSGDGHDDEDPTVLDLD